MFSKYDKNTIERIKSVNILVFNDRNKLALQMRAKDNESFPGHWDFSAGGHVDPNEEDQKAAERETLEELGITGQLILISKEHFQYPAWTLSVLREVDLSIYKIFNNGPFKIDPKEVEEVEFFSLPTIQKMIDSGIKFHPEFLLAWKKGIVSEALVMGS